jgi:hypothetical protein
MPTSNKRKQISSILEYTNFSSKLFDNVQLPLVLRLRLDCLVDAVSLITEDSHETHESGQPVSGPRFQSGISRSRSANGRILAFGFFQFEVHFQTRFLLLASLTELNIRLL